MDLKDLFWKDISIKLKETYILNSLPETWKKGEIEIFLSHLKDKVNTYRIENNLQDESEVKISYDTFRRILVKQETRGSDYTRNLFAQYFGHKSYLEYLNHLEKIKADDATSVKLKKIHRLWMVLFPIGVLFLFAGIYYYFSVKQHNSVCNEIEYVIESAIDEEMEAYKSVPNYAAAAESLKEYFWEDQAAYKKILRILKNEKERNWILTNDTNVSAAELLSLTCEYIDEDLATISTKEHWTIQWYDTQINEYAYLYDTMNTQIYYLKKSDDDKWKITINSYDYKKDRIFVKIFENDSFDKAISIEKIKRKVILLMSTGDTQSALWWLSQYAKYNSLPFLDEIVIVQGKLYKNIRRVNTNEINLDDFYAINKEIDIDIFDLLEKM